MRFAAIADVHGNRLALDAVLEDAADLGVCDCVNLGDHVSGPLQAAQTADLLMELGFPSVRGDQDRRLVELRKDGTSKRSDFQQLDERHFDHAYPLSSGAFVGYVRRFKELNHDRQDARRALA
jgi:predicted phosphodiesterase